MDIKEYNKKLKTLLDEPTHQPISKDPTTYLEKTTKDKIKISNISQKE